MHPSCCLRHLFWPCIISIICIWNTKNMCSLGNLCWNRIWCLFPFYRCLSFQHASVRKLRKYRMKWNIIIFAKHNTHTIHIWYKYLSSIYHVHRLHTDTRNLYIHIPWFYGVSMDVALFSAIVWTAFCMCWYADDVMWSDSWPWRPERNLQFEFTANASCIRTVVRTIWTLI